MPGRETVGGRKGPQPAKRTSDLHGEFCWPPLFRTTRGGKSPRSKSSGSEHPAGRPAVAGLRAAWHGNYNREL